jgi:hypothetical protein
MNWFHAYLHDLQELDLAHATKARYSQIVGSYREWLHGRSLPPPMPGHSWQVSGFRGLWTVERGKTLRLLSGRLRWGRFGGQRRVISQNYR